MKQGWLCPSCGAGVAPGQAYCEHPVRASALPPDFPGPAELELAALLYPSLDAQRERLRFRSYYQHQVTARWLHVWQRWLQSESVWSAKNPKAPAGRPASGPASDGARVRVWLPTAHGGRFETWLFLWQYQQRLAAGQAPELVDPGELARLQPAAALSAAGSTRA